MTNAETIKRLNDLRAIPDMSDYARALIDDLTTSLLISSKNGKRPSAAAVIAKMLKYADTSRPVLCYAWLDSAGRQCTLDGYRAYRLYQALDLPPKPADLDPIDLDKIFPAVHQGERLDGILIPAPDRAAVKAFIDLQRAESGKKAGALYQFGPGLPVVNAVYLLDLLDVLPDAKLYISANAPLVSPIYASGAAGDALLLPVRVDSTERADLLKFARLRLNQATAENPERPVISLDDLALLMPA